MFCWFNEAFPPKLLDVILNCSLFCKREWNFFWHTLLRKHRVKLSFISMYCGQNTWILNNLVPLRNTFFRFPTLNGLSSILIDVNRPTSATFSFCSFRRCYISSAGFCTSCCLPSLDRLLVPESYMGGIYTHADLCHPCCCTWCCREMKGSTLFSTTIYPVWTDPPSI